MEDCLLSGHFPFPVRLYCCIDFVFRQDIKSNKRERLPDYKGLLMRSIGSCCGREGGIMRIGPGFGWDGEDRMQCWYSVTDITYSQESGLLCARFEDHKCCTGQQKHKHVP